MGFMRGADHAVQTRIFRQCRPCQHQFFGRLRETEFAQVALFHAGEHGNANELRLLAVIGHCVGCRFHHAPSARSVHIDQPHAHVGRHFAGLGNGVGNIVVFQIQKQFEALLNQLFHQAAAGSGEEFFADFELAQFGRQAAHKGKRVVFVGKIQRDNDGRACGGERVVGDEGVHGGPR